MKNQVQLITYVDRLSGGGFDDLRELLAGPLAGLFGGVHLLPFFDPIDGADAGFDPIDHGSVDPRLGDWSSVRRLAADTPVMADLIVNHISARSPQFLDFSARGAQPLSRSSSPSTASFRKARRSTICGRSTARARACPSP
jgi:sucrose phosphorylase